MTRRLAPLLILLVSVTACSSGGATPITTAATAFPTTATTTPATTTSTTLATVPADRQYGVIDDGAIEFTDELSMRVFRPDAAGTWPTVVFFHGGSWYGGDPANVEPYARALAAAGLVVFNATYRVGNTGGGFPQSYEDIACAIDVATAEAPGHHGTADVVVAGHSAGAHLASAVVFSGGGFRDGTCASDRAGDVVGFVGLAGPYEAQRFGPLLAQWFGTEYPVDPTPWDDGSPLQYLDSAARIPVLLIHGDRDQLVPVGFSEGFATALDDLGYEVTLDVIAGADHPGVIDPTSAGPRTVTLVETFVNALLGGT